MGATLAATLAEKGFSVYGVEVKQDIVDGFNNFQPQFHEKGLDILLKKYLKKNLFVLNKIPENMAMDAFVIAVGTPLNKKTKKPVMDYVIQASKEVSGYLREKGLVILRSTVPVGTTRNCVLPILKKKCKNFHLAFCPERTIEGEALVELKKLPQIIGGLDEESLNRASELFIKITKTILRVSSLEAAEMIKLLNNAYRDLTFAFANEVGLMAKKLDLDALELIEAANFGYPRADIPVPGFVGGVCLEKDPHILVDLTKKAGYYPKLVKLARVINESLPAYTMGVIKGHFEKMKKDITRAKIFISGFAFKGRPETDDLRGSPTLDFLKLLKGEGAKNISGHDFVVSARAIASLGVKPSSLKEGFTKADCALIMNNHLSYEHLDIDGLLDLMNKPAVFFDGWHIFDPDIIKTHKHIIYEGLGSR